MRGFVLEEVKTTDSGDPTTSNVETGRNGTTGAGGISRVKDAARTPGYGSSVPGHRRRAIPAATNWWECDGVYSAGAGIPDSGAGFGFAGFPGKFRPGSAGKFGGRSVHLPSWKRSFVVQADQRG